MLSAIFRLFNGRNGKVFLKEKSCFFIEKNFPFSLLSSLFLHVKMFSKGKASPKGGKKGLFRDSE